MFMICDPNLAIYLVFYKESESDVKKYKNLEPGEKNQEKLRKTQNNNDFLGLYCFSFVFPWFSLSGKALKKKCKGLSVALKLF